VINAEGAEGWERAAEVKLRPLRLGCYRVYEGAAYKILYKLSGRFPTAVKVLKGALKKAEDAKGGDSTATAQAWIMRGAFDSIVDVHGKRGATQ